MTRAKVTSKGQLTVPKGIRERLGLEPGSHVEIYVDHDGRVVLERTLKVDELAALMPRPVEARTIEEINQGIIEAAVARASRGR